jgi:hypothetical protein
MPIRQAGRLANQVSRAPRVNFRWKMILPRLSRPITWNVFLPRSMPITAILLSAGFVVVVGMGVLLFVKTPPSSNVARR